VGSQLVADGRRLDRVSDKAADRGSETWVIESRIKVDGRDGCAITLEWNEDPCPSRKPAGDGLAVAIDVRPEPVRPAQHAQLRVAQS
jgi:hypothetical protein